MSNRIESFPMLSGNIISELNIKLKSLHANYSQNGLSNELSFVKDEEHQNDYILDNNGVWSSFTNNLQIKGEIVIGNYNILFDEYKIAEKSTTLGIALTYIEKESTKIYSKTIGEINYTGKDDEKTIKFDLNFEAGELSPLLIVEFSIYVKEIKQDDNSIFAKKSGAVLGDFLSLNLIIEGQGSEFPIVMIEDKKLPLWDMEVDFEDFEDIFSQDKICLKINRLHKDFSKLGVDKISNNNTLVWKEILSGFFTNIFLMSGEIDNLENIYNEEQIPGTIGSFLKFLIITFNISYIELKNSILLSRKIREVIDDLL